MQSSGASKAPFKLTNFPPELLGQIILLLEIEDFIHLVLTGDASLARLMARPHVVTRFRLICARLASVHFPNLPLWAPHLRSLELTWISTEPGKHFVDLTLDKLPKSLTSLDIGVLDATSIFGGEGSLIDPKAHLPNLTHLVANVTQPPFAVLLQNMPASLTSLWTHVWHVQIPLPQSLRHFKASSYTFQLHGPMIPLPPALESLDCSQSGWADLESQFVAILPPTLTRLCLNLFYGRLKPATIAALPRGLLELHCDFHQADEVDILHFPPNLTKLETNEIPEKHWKNLPKSITDLLFGKRGHGGPTVPMPAATFFEDFVPNLQRLTCTSGTALWLMPPTAPCIKSLTVLHAKNCVFAASVLAALPATVTSLVVKFLDEERIEQLPSGLRTLEVLNLWLTASSVKKFPKSLEHLTAALAPYHSAKESLLQPPTGSISQFLLQVAPSEDAYAHVADELVKELGTGDCFFPASLKSIMINGGYEQLGDSWLQAFRGDTMESFCCALPMATNACFKYLSRKLRRLNLLNTPNITGEAFADLPDTLTSLELRITDVQDRHIADLPRGLLSLRLNAVVGLTPECIPNLPPKVRHVSLGKCEGFTAENTVHLPRTLYLRDPENRASTTFGTASFSINNGRPL